MVRAPVVRAPVEGGAGGIGNTGAPAVDDTVV